MTDADRLAELDRVYRVLSGLLEQAEPREAAGLAREMRINRAEAASLSQSEGGVELVDELAERRSGSLASRGSRRGRQSG